MAEITSKKKEISAKIHQTIANIHRAFMQPRRTPQGEAIRKQYWLEAWNDIKKLTPSEMTELIYGIGTVRDTLAKLEVKIANVREKKLKIQLDQYALQNLNEWEEDEFLDSAAVLPVFNPKQKVVQGKRWVITETLKKQKTVFETCQCVWTVITNRAISIVDGGFKNVQPSLKRDALIEKHRLATLPLLLDDLTITDPLSGKPLMNIFMISKDVKVKLLYLLGERAKKELPFRKLYVRFLKKEILDKMNKCEWAQRFSSQALQILHELKNL